MTQMLRAARSFQSGFSPLVINKFRAMQGQQSHQEYDSKRLLHQLAKHQCSAMIAGLAEAPVRMHLTRILILKQQQGIPLSHLGLGSLTRGCHLTSVNTIEKNHNMDQKLKTPFSALTSAVFFLGMNAILSNKSFIQTKSTLQKGLLPTFFIELNFLASLTHFKPKVEQQLSEQCPSLPSSATNTLASALAALPGALITHPLYNAMFNVIKTNGEKTVHQTFNEWCTAEKDMASQAKHMAKSAFMHNFPARMLILTYSLTTIKSITNYLDHPSR